MSKLYFVWNISFCRDTTISSTCSQGVQYRDDGRWHRQAGAEGHGMPSHIIWLSPMGERVIFCTDPGLSTFPLQQVWGTFNSTFVTFKTTNTLLCPFRWHKSDHFCVMCHVTCDTLHVTGCRQFMTPLPFTHSLGRPLPRECVTL